MKKSNPITRRRFLQLSAAAGAGLVLPWQIGGSTASAVSSDGRAVSASPPQQVLPQVPLPGSAIAQFVDLLPIPHIIDARPPNPSQFTLTMEEFQSPVMPTGFVPVGGGAYTGTWVWGYKHAGQTATTYLGPVILAQRNFPTQIKFINNLGNTSGSHVLAYTQSTDQTLHWADPLNNEANECNMNILPMTPPTSDCAQHYNGPIPAAVHLHGGEVPAVLDGGPDAWFTSDGQHAGHAYYSKDGASPKPYVIYRYPNKQEAAPIWFHDHTLGATRLNVYAGLAGGYVLTDPAHDPNIGLLPIPLIIQDRMFDTNGQLYFPAGVPFISNPEHPFWVPEFVGDTILVNGKVWPYFNVQPKRYRFLFLNGSNARAYEMFLVNQATNVMGPAMYQIATDGGYLDKPVKIDPNAVGNALTKLVIMPGERADVIIDFAGMPVGTQLLLRNVARTPFPGGATPNGKTAGRIMQFRVVPQTDPENSFDPATNAPLRAPMVRLVNPTTGALGAGVTVQKKRQLTLNEVMGMPTVVGGIAYPGGPLEVLVNNTKWHAPVSETPTEGETEVWEIINLTADAHPIHTHLTRFQLMNRQNFDVKKYKAAYAAAYGGVVNDSAGPPLPYDTPNADGAVGGNPAVTPSLKGAVVPPAPNEAGWKDTVIMFPGQVTRIVVRYTPTDLLANTPPTNPDAHYPFDPNSGHGYVWHCHIIDHEDNEMMRPTSVTARTGVSRTYVQGTDF